MITSLKVWEWVDEYVAYSPKTGSARTVWLVSYDLYRKPVMCLDSQVEHVVD